MPFRTKLTEALGIEHPIVMGGMHYVGYAELAASVSNAGGIGFITALTQPTPEDLRKEIRKCKTLTDKPFGVNFTLLPALQPPDYKTYCRVIIEEGIKVVETAGRKPDAFIKAFKEHGIYVIHKCVQVKHALHAQKLGVDCISMDGFECGGHPGEADVGNWVLLPAAAKRLGIPFIVSGGCATGSQLVAALALGAEGMNMGTRFMATRDSSIHMNIKETMVNGTENDTTLVMRSLRNTERVFKTESAMKVREIESEKPGDIMAIRHLVTGRNYYKSFHETGNPNSVWSCGQSIGLIDDIPTVQNLVNRIIWTAEDIINNRLASYANHPPRSKL